MVRGRARFFFDRNVVKVVELDRRQCDGFLADVYVDLPLSTWLQQRIAHLGVLIVVENQLDAGGWHEGHNPERGFHWVDEVIPIQ